MRLTRFGRCAVVSLASLVLVVAVSSTAFAADQIALVSAPGGVEGFLYEPDGTTPVAGGWIDIQDSQGQPWMGTDTAPNGSFSIANLPAGTYTLRGYPPEASTHAASLPLVLEVFAGQWTEAILRLTEVRLSGWVQDSDTGDRLEGASVVAHDAGWTVERWDATNANGEFKLGGLEIGATYILNVFPPPGTEYVQLPIEYTATPVAADVVLEMHLPPMNIIGMVQDYAGAPVPGAGLVAHREAYWKEATADEMGEFRIRGLPMGEFSLHAVPPWNVQGLLDSAPITVPITTPTTLVDVGVMTLPQAFKMASGQVVLEGTTTGVPEALVQAYRLDEAGYAEAPTDGSGSFTLSMPAGEWHLRATPLHPAAEWVFPGPPAWVAFALPATVSETKTADLHVVPTNAWVSGHVACPGGVPCAGLVGHEAIRVELLSDQTGNVRTTGPDFSFQIPVLAGWYELAVHVDHETLQGPAPVPVFVGPGGSYDAGEIVLLLKDARLLGQVRNEAGLGVPGVLVVAWQPEAFGWGRAETDVAGNYAVPVIGGEWYVEPQPGPEHPYVFSGPPKLARVAPGGTMTGLDFRLNDGSVRIQGMAVESQTYQPIWGLEGWAHAERIPPSGDPVFYSDAPMTDGGFQLKVRGGEQYWVGLDIPPYAPYISTGVGPLAAPPAGHVVLEVPLQQKDAAIEGTLFIAGTQDPALGVWAEIFGEDTHGHWVVASVDPDTAGYRLDVVAGTWHLRAWVDPASGYAAPATPMPVVVPPGTAFVPQDFEVLAIASSISGQVLGADGAPLPGALVFAEGESPFVGHFQTRAESGEQGLFELAVPEGGYVVGAALPAAELEKQGWLNPPPLDVPTVPATNLALHFRALDSDIQGTVRFAGAITVTPTHPAYVWGWADTGEWAEAEATLVAGTNTFTYKLAVVSGSAWHVGAVYEDWDSGTFYESAEAVVTLPTGSPPVTQDLELGGPWPLPQPFIVSFDGTQMQTIVMPDGVELSIPPEALVNSGTVTLFILPTQELRPEKGREMIGPGYEIWAVDQNGKEITQFNKNITMTLHYPPDATLSAQGISEHLLLPLYYSTLVGHWTLADSYVVDTTNNEIKLQMNHFTKFGLASSGYRVYLPMVSRQVQ